MISSAFSFHLLVSMFPIEERRRGLGELEAQDARPELETKTNRILFCFGALCVLKEGNREEGKERPRPPIFNLGTSAKLCCILFTAIKSLSVAL